MSDIKIHCPKCGANDPQPVLQTSNVPKATAGMRSIIILFIAVFASLAIGGYASRISSAFGFVAFFAVAVVGLIICIKVAKQEKPVERTSAVCQKCGNIWVLDTDSYKPR